MQEIRFHYPDSYLEKAKELGYEEGKDLEVIYDEIVLYIDYTVEMMKLNEATETEEEFCKAVGLDPEELLAIELI